MMPGPQALGNAALDKQAAAVSETMEQALYEVRAKIYPRAVSGWFAGWRWTFVLLTQAIYYGVPWLTWNGRQAVLFDLPARKFYLFGLVLWPQDVVYLAILLVISALSLFLFTAVAGRLWCGYACPQTVYSEIFLWIERKVEGKRMQRMHLDAERWSWRKLRIKLVKHILWFSVALWTGLTFVGYFTPITELLNHTASFSLGPWETFWVLFYGFATWGNAGFLREQVCKYMCPYARFQGVMVDQDTYVITYDQQRGEPRGPRNRKTDPRGAGLGDCVECGICVQVCPTGIDIRNGLQNECIGCGACIDACNKVMDRMEYPRGLIRYTSERALLQGWSLPASLHRVARPRVLIYATVWLMLIAASVVALALREPLRVDVLRDRAVLAREVDGELIENIYRLQWMNTGEHPVQVRIGVEGLPGIRVAAVRGALGGFSDVIEVPAEANRVVTVPVRVPGQAASPGSHPIYFVFSVVGGSNHVLREKTTFILPNE